MTTKRASDEQKQYTAPEVICFGAVAAITEGIVCTGLGSKEYTGAVDDVAAYGFWGTPVCSD